MTARDAARGVSKAVSRARHLHVVGVAVQARSVQTHSIQTGDGLVVLVDYLHIAVDANTTGGAHSARGEGHSVERRGGKRTQLARASGVGLRSIQMYEQRQKDINRAQGLTLYALARALRCRMEGLLER